jgi:hypothetical protein
MTLDVYSGRQSSDEERLFNQLSEVEGGEGIIPGSDDVAIHPWTECWSTMTNPSCRGSSIGFGRSDTSFLDLLK